MRYPPVPVLAYAVFRPAGYARPGLGRISEAATGFPHGAGGIDMIAHLQSKLRPMSHTIREKTKLLNRVRRIRGQVEAVERALDQGLGCSEVLQLIAGARE